MGLTFLNIKHINQVENEAHFHFNVRNNFEQRQALLNRIKVIIEPIIEMF